MQSGTTSSCTHQLGLGSGGDEEPPVGALGCVGFGHVATALGHRTPPAATKNPANPRSANFVLPELEPGFRELEG
jgi:hypothetical protein